ncbi:unnamed protein product [Phytophthora fragariaefolia]|uniref:Unnamed protein product n=1 Tax=Phytophthora fragariaefolia TaxID=1490495 RepID=A0A9W6XRW4_9STRA|nr:unnamed protein product [Phytophthora fragariaefolia]
MYKHKKKCKGAKEQLSRSEIRKKSWEKNRAKRVGAQWAKRAARAFDRLQGRLTLKRPQPTTITETRARVTVGASRTRKGIAPSET